MPPPGFAPSPDRAADVVRLEALGVPGGRGAGPDETFVVPADVERNEFCVLSEW